MDNQDFDEHDDSDQHTIIWTANSDDLPILSHKIFCFVHGVYCLKAILSLILLDFEQSHLGNFVLYSSKAMESLLALLENQPFNPTDSSGKWDWGRSFQSSAWNIEKK